MIIKEYTKDGLKLTHPSGIVTITTLAQLTELDADLQERKKMLTEQTTQIILDINRAKQAGAI